MLAASAFKENIHQLSSWLQFGSSVFLGEIRDLTPSEDINSRVRSLEPSVAKFSFIVDFGSPDRIRGVKKVKFGLWGLFKCEFWPVELLWNHDMGIIRNHGDDDASFNSKTL